MDIRKEVKKEIFSLEMREAIEDRWHKVKLDQDFVIRDDGKKYEIHWKQKRDIYGLFHGLGEDHKRIRLFDAEDSPFNYLIRRVTAGLVLAEPEIVLKEDLRETGIPQRRFKIKYVRRTEKELVLGEDIFADQSGRVTCAGYLPGRIEEIINPPDWIMDFFA